MTDISAAREALMNYQQADMDGIMVLASRQAIHEVTGHIDALEASNKALTEALRLADAELAAANMNIAVVERKARAAIAEVEGLK